MHVSQARLDRIRFFNKRVTNKFLIHLCGRRFGHFAILSHVGRKSGAPYRTPVIAEPLESGFVIALTYGKQVDWLKNILAAGECGLYWKQKEVRLVRPELIDPTGGLPAFPRPIQAALRKIGIEHFVRLDTETLRR
jgi:deazaflavin-dependent oxidoreductase (nitroreductase family)